MAGVYITENSVRAGIKKDRDAHLWGLDMAEQGRRSPRKSVPTRSMGTSRKMGMLKARVQRVVRERVSIVFYDPKWPELFVKEKAHLIRCLPSDAIGKIEHFGSTAVPGLAAKPIIDMLVEVPNLEDTRRRIVPILESLGYDYF